MKTIELTFDDARWAEVPLEFPAGPYATQDEWATAVASEYSQGATDPSAARTALERVAKVLPTSPRPALFKMLWYQADPFRLPLLVDMYVVPDALSQGLTLAELAGAFDDGLVRPPVVDNLESAAFGTIARVIGVSKDGERDRLVMRLCAAGRLNELVIMLDMRTSELDYGTLALEDFTALMEGVTVTDQDEPGGV
jgi:hypothetical protein